MNTLIISNELWIPEWVNMDLCRWDEDRYSAEGYDTVILDLNFGLPTTQGYYDLPSEDANFYELGAEVAKSLQAGGVVIALLGPLAVTGRDMHRSYVPEIVSLKKDFKYEGKYLGNFETSYEWLDYGFLKAVKIDTMFAKMSEGVTVVSPRRQMKKYIDFWSSKYWVSISGIRFHTKSKIDGYITYYVAQPTRWDCANVERCPVKVLAIGKHSKLPVAIAVRYTNWDGVLILMPSYEFRQTTQPSLSEEITGLFNNLQELAIAIKEDFTTHDAAEHDKWVYKYRAPQAKEIASDIEKVKEKEKELIKDLQTYDGMLVLLDGTDEPLVDGVVDLFDKPGEGLKVKRTEKGATLDLFVHDDRGRTLAIEVTGIKHALRKDDPHWADFLEYIPEHNAKNESGRVERIVLVVNTECKTELSNRHRSNDISDPVKKTVTDNHICIIRSCDLYKLWLEILDGKPVSEIFDMLFECEGIWQP